MEINKRIRLALLLILVGVFIFPIPHGIADFEPMEFNNSPDEIDLYINKLPDEIDLYINKLADYECRNCPVDFRIVDVNGYYSYSCLQFQKRTFVHYAKRLLPEIEEKEYDNLIYNCDIQKKLAKQMLLEDPENIWHWANSVKRGLGLPPNYN